MSATRTTGLAAAEACGGLYPLAFTFDTGFGRCVGVDLSSALAADPETLPMLLHPEERRLCLGMRGARLVEFAGGRIAARLAREGMPGADRPTIRGPAGQPLGGNDVSLSVSHARRFAVALATAETGCTIGIDIEALDEDDDAIPLLAGRILSDEERTADRTNEPIPLLRRLSLKEAAYKALFPRSGHIPLRAISVLRPDGDGSGYRVIAPAGRGPIAAACRDFDRHVLSFVRVG